MGTLIVGDNLAEAVVHVYFTYSIANKINIYGVIRILRTDDFLKLLKQRVCVFGRMNEGEIPDIAGIYF